MEFGLFYQLPCAREQSTARRFDELIAEAQLAQRLGFDIVWLAEHHFSANASTLAAPLLLCAAIAQATEQIKIGTAVALLPLHNPVQLAEEVATLDMLSHGRAVFGIGRGSTAYHFQGYGVPLEQARERYLEGLEVIVSAWTKEEFSHHGRHFNYSNLKVEPKPYQQPHPPVYVAANSLDTFAMAGSMGHHLMLAPLRIKIEGAKAGLETYRRHRAENGHALTSAKVALTVPVFVDRDGEKARAVAEDDINRYLERARAISGGLAPEQATKANGAAGQGPERSARATFEEIYDQASAIGDPARCVAQLKSLQEMFQPSEFMCWYNMGGLMTPGEVAESMRLFAAEVMPHFR